MKFAILFLLWPLAELMLLIEVGGEVGFFMLLLLLVAGGVAGVMLQQFQAIKAMEAFHKLKSGAIPMQNMFVEICVFVASVLLIIPGFISDFIALLLLMPPVRNALRRFLDKRFKGETVSVGGFEARWSRRRDDEIIEAEFSHVDEQNNQKPPMLP